jgi:hypothetical protein
MRLSPGKAHYRTFAVAGPICPIRPCDDGIAQHFALLGKKNEAVAWLEKAYAARSGGMVWLKSDTAFDSMHSKPAFLALMRRMKFPE